MPQKVAVLGTGKIGEALLSGMIRGGWAPADLLVTARRQERAEELRARYGVSPVTNAEAAKTAWPLRLISGCARNGHCARGDGLDARRSAHSRATWFHRES